MQPPPIRSVGEVTSDLSTSTTTATEDAHPLPPPPPSSSSSSTEPRVSSLADAPPTQPQFQPSVLSWEQLSGYTGFTPLDVQAGLQASLRMFVLHTHQIFFRETANYDELMSQVGLKVCVHVHYYVYSEVPQAQKIF